VKQFFLQGEIDGVPVRWLVLRSTDGAVTWLDEHLVQEVVSSTWATTTFSDLEVKEATDPMPKRWGGATGVHGNARKRNAHRWLCRQIALGVLLTTRPDEIDDGHIKRPGLDGRGRGKGG
jgi:hypothetical protein